MSLIVTNPNSSNYTKTPLAKVLWVNASPDASFAAQDVALSESALNFSLIVVQFKAFTNTGTSGARMSFSYYWMSPEGRTHLVPLQMHSGSNNRLGHRFWNIQPSGLTCRFATAYYNGSSDNDYLVPQSILGINLGGMIK